MQQRGHALAADIKAVQRADKKGVHALFAQVVQPLAAFLSTFGGGKAIVEYKGKSQLRGNGLGIAKCGVHAAFLTVLEHDAHFVKAHHIVKNAEHGRPAVNFHPAGEVVHAGILRAFDNPGSHRVSHAHAQNGQTAIVDRQQRLDRRRAHAHHKVEILALQKLFCHFRQAAHLRWFPAGAEARVRWIFAAYVVILAHTIAKGVPGVVKQPERPGFEIANAFYGRIGAGGLAEDEKQAAQ